MRRKKKAQVSEPLLEMGSKAAGAVPTAKSKQEWTKDSEQSSCSGCEKKFTVKRRKHHCRHCGGLFCNECCSTKFKRNLAVGDGDATKPVRVCSLCWHSLELLSEGPLDSESPLAMVTRNDEAHQPQGQILALIAVAKHGTVDAQSALARKVTERLQEPEIPIKLKCLRLISLLAEDSSSHFKSLLKHDATSTVRALTRFTMAPDPVLGDKPAQACRNAAIKCLAVLDGLADTRDVIGRSKVPQRTDAGSMKSAMRIAKRRAGSEWATFTPEQKRLAIEKIGEESPLESARSAEGETGPPELRLDGDMQDTAVVARRLRTATTGQAKVVGAADVGALLGGPGAAPAGNGRDVATTGQTATAGGRANHRTGLGISRPGSPDAVGRAGREHGNTGLRDAQQQILANRIDYNQAEIERRDEEIANIEQTVDDIQEVFADLAVLVDTQDEQIDLVEENVDQVVTMTEEAGEELMAAERYQKSNRKRTLGLFLVVLVLVILLLVIIIRGQDDG